MAKKRVEYSQPARLPAFLFHTVHASQFHARPPSCFRGRHAGMHQVFGVLLNMKNEFLAHFLLEIASQAEYTQYGT